MSVAALPAPTGLSQKSRRIIAARVQGRTTTEICARYGISPRWFYNLSCSKSGRAYKAWLEALLAEGARTTEYDTALCDFLSSSLHVSAA